MDDIRQTIPQTPLFLRIPVSRLIFLSIVSFRLYEAYWFYRNWRYLKERNLLEIRPFWRGIFSIFFCHSLLNRIRDDKEASSIQEAIFSPSALATGWVGLAIFANIVSQAPGAAATIISALIPSFSMCTTTRQSGSGAARFLANHLSAESY